MTNFTSTTSLPLIDSFEEFEKLKSTDIFDKLAKEIIAFHHLPNDTLSLFEGTNIVFSYGNSRIIKIYPLIHQDHFQHELLVLKHLEKKLL